MDQSLLLPLLAAAGIVILGIALSGKDDDLTTKRVKDVAKEKESVLKRKSDPDADRRKKLLGGIKDLEMKEKQMRKARLAIGSRLEQAGLTIKEQTFWIISVGVGVAAFFGVIVAGQPLLWAAGAGAILGLGFPRWVLGFLCKGRQKKFTNEFAGAIEVIVRGVKSGLPLNECLKIIAREAPEPLGSEFRRLCDGLAMGVPLDQGLGRMFERMPLPEVSFFSIVLAIQQKAGGNLSEALQNLATVLRSRKLMREKINALSSEAKASAMIIGSLPIIVCILVSVTSPDYMALLFTDPTGHMGLGAGITMMTLGVLVMRQMINFEI
jgi:tight adherence protein B